MTSAAVSTGIAILALIGLAVGIGVAGLVVALFNRIVRPAREIDAYADDILEAGLGIARNLDGVDALQRTRDLGAAVPGLASAYLHKLEGGGS
jgi:hypothetical protein